MTFATIQEARAAQSAASTEWWSAYMKRSEREPELKQKLHDIEAAAVAQFAKPEVADCKACASSSVFGGPGHYASPNCQSGRRPHCSCDTCY